MSNEIKHRWTKPHHGVSHLDNGDGTGWQITLEDRGEFVQVYALNLYSKTPFTSVDGGTFANVEVAKVHGEWMAERYDVYRKRVR